MHEGCIDMHADASACTQWVVHASGVACPPIICMQDTRFHVGMVGAHCYLLVHQPASREAMGVRLLLSSRATTNVLAGSASDESEGMLADTPAHALLSYFYHIFEKYPARAALGNTLSPTHVHFLLHSGAKKAHSKGLLEYTAQLWEALVDTTKKDFQGVEFTFHAQLGWHLPSGVLEGATPLGAWVAQAITRVPIQLCRVEGGQLQPMSNGQRMAVNPAVDSMDEIASLISFGLYDSVLEATKLPLVVVSSMGAQSTGKSYQLNHLGGTLFGVSGKRCTDGILMTVRSVVWKVGAEGRSGHTLRQHCSHIACRTRHMRHCIFTTSPWCAASTRSSSSPSSCLFVRLCAELLEQMTTVI